MGLMEVTAVEKRSRLLSLYREAESLHREAVRAYSQGEYGDFPRYMETFNRLLGEGCSELKVDCPPLKPLKVIPPPEVPNTFYLQYLHEAVLRFLHLSAYLSLFLRDPKEIRILLERVKLGMEERIREMAHLTRSSLLRALEEVLEEEGYPSERGEGGPDLSLPLMDLDLYLFPEEERPEGDLLLERMGERLARNRPGRGNVAALVLEPGGSPPGKRKPRWAVEEGLDLYVLTLEKGG
jgi:hypothetical protein